MFDDEGKDTFSERWESLENATTSEIVARIINADERELEEISEEYDVSLPIVKTVATLAQKCYECLKLEQILYLSEEYGVDPEIVEEVIDATNSFRFIRSAEERDNFVQSVLITYITGAESYPEGTELTYKGVTGRELHLESMSPLGDIIDNAAHDCYEHYITPSDEVDIARVRSRFTNENNC